jgi:enamine deaminase RidA (YjgF/YER057c/UK114 family)
MNRHFNPATSFPPQGAYSHGVDVPPGSRMVYVAGQVGVDKDGNTPEDFASEADNAFANVVRVLADAGMEPTDIVKLNTYLTRPEDMATLRPIREKHFGDHAPAATLVYVAGLAAPIWHIEIEAVAAKKD